MKMFDYISMNHTNNVCPKVFDGLPLVHGPTYI